MSDEQKIPSGKDRARDDRQAKLSEALRANLRRRKAAAAPPPAHERGGGGVDETGGDA